MTDDERRQMADRYRQLLRDAFTPPALDSRYMCSCPCHNVLVHGRTHTTTEQRLGVLESPVDYVVACGKCTPKHHQVMHGRKGNRVWKYTQEQEEWE